MSSRGFLLRLDFFVSLQKIINMKTLVVYFSATGTTKAYPQYSWGESRLMNM